MNEFKLPTGFVPAREATKLLHVKSGTLRNWAEAGKIEYIKKGDKGSHRYYNIKSFFEKRGFGTDEDGKTENISVEKPRRFICYCRVSTRNQKDDLERQVQFLKQSYPNHEFITDIGSGLNFKRKGLQTILELAHRGEIQELVVAHKDRLCRFGFEIVEFVITKFSNGQITILDNSEVSKEQELVNDILSIIIVFSARVNGLRKYQTNIQTEFRNRELENEKNTVLSNTNPKEVS